MNNNKCVYVVTDGCYSDYHIVAIYDNAEDARLLAETCGYNEVDEWPLDTPVYVPAGMFAYSVDITLTGGILSTARLTPDDIGKDTEQWRPFYISLKNWRSAATPMDGFTFNAWARDAAHAQRIAIERRQGLIAADMDKLTYTQYAALDVPLLLEPPDAPAPPAPAKAAE